MISQIRNGVALVALTSVTNVLALPTQQLTSRASALQASTDLCGDEDYIILNSSPWIVYNMLYNADEMVGTQCTYYDSMTTASDGTAEVKWNSETDITYVESTNNVPKGYSFVGLTANLENTIDSIGSIPSTYTWTRTNTTAFKGNVCFDFMTNDVKGDSTSSSSQELMLWLEYEGGQLPIGWADEPVATIDNLFGTSWNLYQGENTDTGITVSSMLPTTQFEGTFEGDLKDWLLALVDQGLFTTSTYVNVGNAGTEFFYGNAIMNATLGLQIDLGTSTTSNVVAVSSSSIATSSVKATSTHATKATTSSSSSSSSTAVVEIPSSTSSVLATSVASISTATSAHHVATPVAPIAQGSTIVAASSAVATSVAQPSTVTLPSKISSISSAAAVQTSAVSGVDGEGDDECDS